MLVLSAVSLLGTTFCFAEAPVPLQVDACVVEVSASSLYGAGGVKKLESFTMLNVLWALREDGGGKIVDNMRVILISGQEASYVCTGEKTEDIVTNNEKHDEEIASEIEASISFQVHAETTQYSTIALKFNFKQVFEEKENIASSNDDDGEDVESETEINRHWSGGTAIKAGQSVIAGIAQDDKKVTFLILTADIVK